MKRAQISEDLVGKRLTTEIRIESDQTNVLYKLRLPEGKKLTTKDIHYLQNTNLEFVCIKDKASSDFTHKFDIENISEIHDETVQILDKSVNDILDQDHDKAHDLRNLETLHQQIKKLIDAIKKTDYLRSFSLLRHHDDHTAQHSFDVCKLALEFAIEQRDFFLETLEEENGQTNYEFLDPIREMGLGALLHDIGKWTVSKEALTKSDQLSDHEWAEIEEHPIRGYELLKNLDEVVSRPVLLSTLDHHETYDGFGYPLKKSGRQIHLFGRIIKVVDVYSALTSNRPYSVGVSPKRAKQEMQFMQNKEKLHFDPKIFSKFMEMIPPYPIGQRVILSDGSMGVVVDYDPDEWNQPWINILNSSSNRFERNQTIQANTVDTPSIVN